MVLVDSSVWIQYLGFHASWVDPRLEALIRPANQVVITGIIFQEILQGIGNPRSYLLTRKLLGRLPFLIPGSQTHAKAANIFRVLSAKGKKPATIDTLIAALALEYRISLFTLDGGFQWIKTEFDLKLF